MAELPELESHHVLDNFSYDEIVPGLYVGSAPPTGIDLSDRFDTIVLTSGYQPPRSAFPGISKVIHSPMEDSYDIPKMTSSWQTAVSTARMVAEDVKKGRRVLVSCWLGRNRSATVAALALHFLTGCPGWYCLEKVRKRRKAPTGGVISNRFFSGLLQRMRGSCAIG